MNDMAKKNIAAYLSGFFEEKSACNGIEAAFLYSSRAGGFPRVDSDVDIALLLGEGGRSDEEIFNIITDISLELTEALGAEVSILRIHPDFREPMLYYNAVITGSVLFFNDFSKLAELKNEAIRQMEDFTIFGEKWRLQAARKNLEGLRNA